MTEYYNEKLNCLKHFKFRKLFLRKTKNVYIGFIPEPFLQKLIEASPITYPSIFKRLIRKNLACRINELRDFYATFTVGNGLIREEVDLLQGRIPPNIFI
ncbi:hypothetical protein GTO27_06420 [Candidatus Bathyarchaeota archaeon]|nr:hypothetical protein [Candidatus Bathyarchaeota archaeon]